eukprot:TRINITY_DN22099_c0_g1_i1.p1 TRINITY_DN22099_c0_g1~~TRINITY_DN22099_c0_g1_i1.p1  ORF type:complete len:539 (+),score=82.25 TRINITY_DN22099_c0_g1_i1:34-1617(+)
MEGKKKGPHDSSRSKKRDFSIHLQNILPNDLIFVILSYLSLEEKRCCRLVNNFFRQALDGKLLALCVKTSSTQLPKLLTSPSFSKVERLHTDDRHFDLRHDLNRHQNIKTLHLESESGAKFWPDSVIELHITRCIRMVHPRQATSLPPEVYSNITTLSLSGIDSVDLSCSHLLTSLDFTGEIQSCNQTLLSIPHPKKLIKLRLAPSPPNLFQLPPKSGPSDVLDRFPNVTWLLLCGYETSNVWHHLQVATLHAWEPKKVIALLGSSPIRDLRLLDFARSDSYTILPILPKTISHLSFENKTWRPSEGPLDPPPTSHLPIEHLYLRGCDYGAFPLAQFAHLQTLEIFYLDIRMLSDLPPKCSKLIIHSFMQVVPADPVDPPSQVRQVHVYSWDDASRIIPRKDLDVILHMDKWPNRLQLENATKRQCKYADPMLRHVVDRLSQAQHAKTPNQEWKKIEKEAPWLQSIPYRTYMMKDLILYWADDSDESERTYNSGPRRVKSNLRSDDSCSSESNDSDDASSDDASSDD